MPVPVPMPIATSDLPPPVCFGAPPKFAHWRNLQAEAVQAAMSTDKRFILQAMPTGAGKSVCYVAQALITGARTCILTSTKALQGQLMTDFAPSGLVDIRGMNAYPCRAAEDFGLGVAQQAGAGGGGVSIHTVSCDEGPCRSGLKCSLRDAGCGYYDAYREALGADLVVTNYAYWMTIHKYGEGLGKFDLLVCDEGHNAPDELSSFLSIELEAKDIADVLGTQPLADGSELDDWRKWATFHCGRLAEKLDRVQQALTSKKEQGGMVTPHQLREAAAGRRALGKLKSLAGIKGAWVWERQGKTYKFDPVWPSEYMELLFRGIKKVAIFSATLRPKTASVLGIPPGDMEFRDWPSPFPVARRPVIHVPTARLNHRSDATQLRTVITRIDQIISQRLDRKGIIHTTSFEKRNFVLQNSEYAALMMTNESRNTRAVVERFQQADAPCILVSPSLTTGFDFPGADCRYQILMKVPFLDRRALIMKARCDSDRDYDMYITAQNLVQTTGRGMRSADDWCESIVLDDNVKWFAWKYKHFLPRWWLDSLVWAKAIPGPLSLGAGV